jgi:protein-S-isoprenylcysteine O-methyltransferase Ste14
LTDVATRRAGPRDVSQSPTLAPFTRRVIAGVYGVVNHASFAVAVAAMAYGLYHGMSQEGVPHLNFGVEGGWRFLWNGLLLLQFPLVHSWFLTPKGRSFLAKLAPFGTGRTLGPTIFTTLASWQIFLAFSAWQPVAESSWSPTGWPLHAWQALFAASWVLLLKTLVDGGFTLQTGSLGWMALWRGERPQFPGLRTRGTFAACRQPIYLAFGLLLWTGPVWTIDHLAVAVLWSVYCVVGPIHKERRFQSMYGDAFITYKSRIPYFVPKFRT